MFGRQVLLCLDAQGDVVIVELKRGMTPRDVTAQAIDYATWVRDLSNKEIQAIAQGYLRPPETLDLAFRKKFGMELPEILNESHRMLVVGTGLDASTDRIIEYLSQDFGVGINAATFGYFRGDDGAELLGRVFLIEPETAEYHARASSKRAPPLTYEELQDAADKAGVAPLYRALEEGLGGPFQRGTTRTSLRFSAEFKDTTRVVLSLIPKDSSAENGLAFQVYLLRLCEVLGLSEDETRRLLPPNREEWAYTDGRDDPDWSGYQGYFQNQDEVDQFIRGVHASSKAGS